MNAGILTLICCLSAVVIALVVIAYFQSRKINALDLGKRFLFELSKSNEIQGPPQELVDKLPLSTIQDLYLSLYTFDLVRVKTWKGQDIGQSIICFIDRISDTKKREYFLFVLKKVISDLDELELAEFLLAELEEEIVNNPTPGREVILEAREAFENLYFSVLVENPKKGKKVIEILDQRINCLIPGRHMGEQHSFKYRQWQKRINSHLLKITGKTPRVDNVN